MTVQDDASPAEQATGNGRPETDAPVTARAAPVQGVAACIDSSRFSDKVIPHALAFGAALNSPVTLLRVLEAKRPPLAPLDPVEWDLRLREARDDVERIADDRRMEHDQILTEVIAGEPAEQISQWTRDNDIQLTVLCTHGESGVSLWGCGSTAQKLLDRVHGSLLLVPHDFPTARIARYHRLVVPLDGSSHAESVLPLATRLARAHGAEIVLVHVVPEPELTEVGPVEKEAFDLRDQLIERNKQVGERYLERTRTGLGDDITVRTLLVSGGDVRTRLVQAATEQGTDLVLFAAHGRSRRPDVPFGSVAAHLITHAGVPLLIVRRYPTHLAQRESNGGPVRLPNQAQ